MLEVSAYTEYTAGGGGREGGICVVLLGDFKQRKAYYMHKQLNHVQLKFSSLWHYTLDSHLYEERKKTGGKYIRCSLKLQGEVKAHPKEAQK